MISVLRMIIGLPPNPNIDVPPMIPWEPYDDMDLEEELEAMIDLDTDQWKEERAGSSVGI